MWKYRHCVKDDPKSGAIDRQPGSGRLRSVCVNENTENVEDIVFSQEDNPKTHRLNREISCETGIHWLTVHRIIYHDLQVNCVKRRRAPQLFETNRVARLTRCKQLLYATLFDTVEMEIAINYFLYSQSVSECQFHMRFHDSIGAFLDCLPDWTQGLRHFQCSRWHTQNAVCHCPVADQSYPLFGLSLTSCRYFHILSTCYEPVWQILGLKELMCK